MNMQKKRILVVDDEPSITRLLKLNLEQTEEFVVETVNDAPRALHAAETFRPDLIVLDVMMPGVDGGQLAERFHDDPRFRTVPIVILTAMVKKQEVQAHHGLIGGLPFLAKPVDIPEVVARLREQLAA